MPVVRHELDFVSGGFDADDPEGCADPLRGVYRQGLGADAVGRLMNGLDREGVALSALATPQQQPDAVGAVLQRHDHGVDSSGADENFRRQFAFAAEPAVDAQDDSRGAQSFGQFDFSELQAGLRGDGRQVRRG